MPARVGVAGKVGEKNFLYHAGSVTVRAGVVHHGYRSQVVRRGGGSVPVQDDHGMIGPTRVAIVQVENDVPRSGCAGIP